MTPISTDHGSGLCHCYHNGRSYAPTTTSPTCTARTATIAAIGKDLPSHRYQAERTIDASGQYVMPGGIDVHTHLDMPFGGTTSTDDFETGTLAAAFGGTTSLVDFAIQYRGQHDAPRARRLDGEGRRARRSTDYWFHMIVTDLPDADLDDMDTMVRDEGVTSFKLFMAYPGVFMVDDATIFRALRRDRRERRPDLHARRERRRHRRARAGSAAQGAERAEVSRAHASAARRGRSDRPRHRARGDGRRADLHRPPLVAPTRCRRSARRATWACPPTPRPARSTCSSPTTTTRSRASTARSTCCRRRCARSGTRTCCGRASQKNDLQVISTDHCPFCMSEQKELGKDDFTKIPNGAPGVETRLTLVHNGGVRPGRISLNRFVELVLDHAGEDVRPVPAQGDDRRRQRRRHRRLRSRSEKQTLGVKTLHMRVDYNPYEGTVVEGLAERSSSRRGRSSSTATSSSARKAPAASSSAARAWLHPGCSCLSFTGGPGDQENRCGDGFSVDGHLHL